MIASPPLSKFFDLSRLLDAGAEIPLCADAGQRNALAEWAGINAVEEFETQVVLHRMSANRFAYDATVSADIVQSCVVTLASVRSHLDLKVSRELHLSKLPASASAEVCDLAADAREGHEEIDDSRYDLAAPLLEEFSLAIDPYPRAPGVVFESPAREDALESPFAALKAMKERK